MIEHQSPTVTQGYSIIQYSDMPRRLRGSQHQNGTAKKLEGHERAKRVGQSTTLFAEWQWMDVPKDRAAKEKSSDWVQV